MPQLTEPDEAFAEEYLAFVTRALDRFEFFGADPRRITRRHRFDDGYVPLTLNQRDPRDGGTVSEGARADQALGDHQRALVRGVAGSGKSTLLRWLGVDTAQGRVEPLNGPPAVPFVLELGRFAEGRLPDLGQVVTAALRPAMPDGWIHRMLADGRVLLLLDGLDEVRPREREHIEDWVEEHLTAHPGTRCVVTTRPSAVAEQWWVDRGFQRFDLLPMGRYSIERYVHGWHSVARADYPPDSPGGAAARESLDRCERELLATLPNRPALRGMSANPLLCGLLCALHLERGEHLPEARKQVYDAALELLLVSWPHLRRRHREADREGSSNAEPDAGIDLRLSAEELVKLLQRLAFWLVTNRQLVLSPDIARQRVQSCMFGLRGGDEDPDRVLRYLAQESGALRELPDGSLEFVHRTFRDHLAAKEVVEEANLTLMLDSADKPQWHDVVVMAGAHARPAERASVLRELLARGQADPEHRDTLYLLAAAILEQSTVLPPQDPQSPDVRALVHAAMAELIPPRTSAAADQLAAAGPFVLDLLPGPDGLTAQQATLVVRAAARIAARWNPPGAVEKILQFTRNRGGVFTQLLEPWGRLGDYEAYARDVLGEVDFSQLAVDLQSRHRIEHIGHLRTITTLVLRNDILDLGPLAQLPRLRRLTLHGNTMTRLAPLAAAPSLQIVRLEGCSSLASARPVDLAPLGGLGLRKLVVSGLTSKVDLGSLADARLFSLSLSGSALRGAVLPPGLHVGHLRLVATRACRIGLAGVRGLRTITLGWAPTDDELAELARLPELRRLVLCRVEHGTPTPALPGVEVVVCWAPPAGS